MIGTPGSARSDQRPKQLAAMFLVGAVLVGGALGFTADRVVGDRLLPRAEAATPPAPNSSLDEFSTEIRLTPAQRAAVDSIMDERHRIIDSIMAPVRPEIAAARESARKQIRARLTPEQEMRFDDCTVKVDGPAASAVCNGEIRYVRRLGDQTPRTQNLSWAFDLVRKAERWQIANVNAK